MEEVQFLRYRPDKNLLVGKVNHVSWRRKLYSVEDLKVAMRDLATFRSHLKFG